MIKVLASGSKGNCYLIETSKEILILECGIAWKDIVCNLNFDLSKVVGCLISHQHKDHCKDIKHILNNSIDIYTSKSVIEKNKITDLRRVHIISSLENLKIGNFKIKTFDCNHTNNDGSECENLGFIINHKELGTIAFVTDTYYLKYKLDNINHLLIECNYCEKDIQDLEPYRARIFKSHMSLETLKEALKTWDLSTIEDITLIHLSESNADENYMKEEIEKLTGVPVYIAKKGLILDV